MSDGPDTLQQALAAHAQGRLDEATSLGRALLAANPNRFDVWHFVAVVESARGRHAEAVDAYDRSISLHPSDPTAHYNRANSLQALQRWSEAVASYDAALSIRQSFPEALNNRGNALQHLNRFNEAVASFDAALAIERNNVDAWINRGNALQRARRFDEALAGYDAALSIRPDHAEAHFSKAHCLLLTGDFENGWDAYERRWDTAAQRDSKRPFSQTMWDGREHIADRTILIHAEQGLGDTIQFCRYLPLLRDKGAHIILEVQPALKRLLQGLGGAVSVLARGEALPRFDFHCPLLSLPRVLATRISTIPRPPHLSVSNELIEKWGSRLPPTRAMRVGIVWAGRAGYGNDRTRAIGLEPLLALSALPVQLVSLQKELPDGDQSILAAHNIAHFGAELTDFLDTAALASSMDVIISVDTAAAHLAATLGRETWLLLRFAADWRWLLDRHDSPWYPSARLFRQPAPGDWASVVATVRAELAHRL